jgi:hypothetical protein
LLPVDRRVRPTGKFLENAYSSIYSTTFYFGVLPGMRMLPVQIHVRDWQPEQTITVKVYDTDDKRIYRRALSVADTGGKWVTLRISVKKPGVHRLEVQDQKNGFTLRPPEGVPMSFQPFKPHGWNRVYFYVPKRLKKLAIYNPPRRNAEATLFGPDGAKKVLQQDGPLVLLDVPPAYAGRVWSIRRPGGSEAVRLLNAPTVFSLAPDTLMIPRGAR